MTKTFPSCEVSYIYTLNEPDTSIVRYVGQSVTPKNRYKQHLHRKKEGRGLLTHKVAWISSLEEKGLKPSLEVIQCFSKESINELEIFYIDLFKKKALEVGTKLTNSDNGMYFISEFTLIEKAKASKKKYGSVGISKKKGIYEVYAHVEGKQQYCGGFRNKRVAQKVYDAVARYYYKGETELITNFQNTFKFDLNHARELSLRFSRMRKNWTMHKGIYPVYKRKNAWDVKAFTNNTWVYLGRAKDLKLAIKVQKEVESGNLTIKEANKKLVKRKSYNKGISSMGHGYKASIYLEGKNRSIGCMKNLEDLIYFRNAVYNYYGKEHEGLDKETKLSLEEAKQLVKSHKLK